MTKWIDGNPYEIAATIVIAAFYIWAKLSLKKEKEKLQHEKNN
jgi:hypothetical protein